MQALLAKEKGIGKKLLAVLMAVVLAVGVALPTGALSGVDEAWGASSVNVNGVSYQTTETNDVSVSSNSSSLSAASVYVVDSSGNALQPGTESYSNNSLSLSSLAKGVAPNGYDYLCAMIILSDGTSMHLSDISYNTGSGNNGHHTSVTGWAYSYPNTSSGPGGNGTTTASIPNGSTILLIYTDALISNNEGVADHLEVEVDAAISVDIDGDGVEDVITVGVSASDTFTVSAFYYDANGNKVAYTGFVYTNAMTGNGSTENATVKLAGAFPVGTYTYSDNVYSGTPIYYVISLIKDVTIALSDGTSVTVPVTLSATIHYWDFDNNNCPGVKTVKENSDGSETITLDSTWTAGNFKSGSGIDVAVSGSTVLKAITEGKLVISKDLYNDTTSKDISFTFTVQNTYEMTLSSSVKIPAGSYLRFTSSNELAGYAVQNESGTYELYDIADMKTSTDASAELPSDCYVAVKSNTDTTLTKLPEGQYTITEIQREGYVISDAEGNKGTNYTVNYTVETQDDEVLSVATFVNKKIDSSAALSIKKVASGLASGSTYPPPTVNIYSATKDATGNYVKSDAALWTGTLTPNGDTWYLPITLEAGTYIVEETGAECSGSSLSATLTVDGEAVAGMVFTVEESDYGKVLDLVVSNVYQNKASVTITKNVAGNMGDQAKEFTFNVKITLPDGNAYVPSDEYTQETDGSFEFVLKHGGTLTFADIPVGSTVVVTEMSSGYEVSINGTEVEDAVYSGTVPVNGLTIAYTNTSNALVDTGVSLGSLPYLVILGGALLCGLVLAGRMASRRKED